MYQVSPELGKKAAAAGGTKGFTQMLGLALPPKSKALCGLDNSEKIQMLGLALPPNLRLCFAYSCLMSGRL